MERRTIMLALLLLALATLACNAPTEPTTAPPATVTPFIPGGETTTPTQPTEEAASPTPSPEVSPSPTQTQTPTPTPTPESTTQSPPVSTGPLDFNIPTSLDHWEPIEGGRFRVTINLHITGGAPPFTIHHDTETFQTSQREYPLIFERGGCGAIVHTIIIQSADGQQVSHDYYITAPWCVTPSP